MACSTTKDMLLPTRELTMKKLLGRAGLGLLGIGLYGAFASPIVWVYAQEIIYTGLGTYFLSLMLPEPLTQAHALPENPRPDDISRQASFWTPIANRSASFKTEQLKVLSRSRMVVSTVMGNVFFHLAFTLAGLGCLVLAVVMGFAMPGSDKAFAGIPLVVAVVMLGSGLKNLIPRPLGVFDLIQGGYLPDPINTPANKIPLTQIHGLQLLQSYRSNQFRHSNLNQNSYYSYELNLILKNGNRINVLSHGHKPDMILDGKRLALFLGVPIWHRLE